jgi:cholesterol transport system auxiliary component
LFDPPVSVKSAALVVLLALAGCGATVSSPVTFDLSVPAGRALSSAGRSQLLIADPTALQALSSDRIVVTTGPTISYLGGAQWSDQLPTLVQARLITSFENSGRAVARPGGGVSADYTLNLNLRRFEIASGEQPEAVVEISAAIVSLRDGRIAAARVFTNAVPVATVSARDGAPALDQAAAAVFGDIVRWVAGRV